MYVDLNFRIPLGGDFMKKSIFKILVLSAPAALLMGCQEPPNIQDSLVTHILNADKVSLDEATYEQVEPFVSPCQGNKLCVQICHRPPGNPENGHSKQLPLAATKAHLGHGDYLGSCSPEDTDPDGDNGTVNDDDDAGPVDNDDPPTWCELYHDIDSDCDGYHDETGESLF